MINVVFDETTRGSLLITRDPVTNSYIKKSEIVCFEWMLDIGYLHDGIESEYRRELPGKLIMQGYWGDNEQNSIPEIGAKNSQNWAMIKSHLQDGGGLRIWYSDAPHSLCGLFHLCTLLRNYPNDYFVVAAPKFTGGERGCLAPGWGSFSQDSLSSFIESQRRLERQEIILYAEHWDKLVIEDSPLRASLSGFPVSVEEDFYDRFIERVVSFDPVQESVVLKRLLESVDFGVYVSWYQARIQEMINNGIIEVVDDPGIDMMHRMIRRKQI